MGLDGFQASTGWLDSINRQHNIKFATLNGESTNVPAANIKEYQCRLPEICIGYNIKDIFNVYESGLFYHQLQCKSCERLIDPPSDNTPDCDFESDVTTEMRQIIDVPFREFINLESDKIIHPVVAEPGTLQADTDVAPDDYQPDEVLDPTPQHKTTIAGHLKPGTYQKKSCQEG